MLLLCLPYAGGSENVYWEWKKYLKSDIHLFPIPLKGRGRRFSEPLYDTIAETVDDIFEIIKNHIYNTDYAIYGHSMGSILAYELYYKLLDSGFNIPKHIFFSGHKAPNDATSKNNYHTLPDSEFIQKVLEIGGTPTEVSNNNELLNLFLPILRSDFRMLNLYDFKERKEKINCDISILNGRTDSIRKVELLLWQTLAGQKCEIFEFKGDHFFINHDTKRVVNVINSILVKDSHIRICEKYS